MERPDWGHTTDLDDVSGRAAIAGVVLPAKLLKQVVQGKFAANLPAYGLEDRDQSTGSKCAIGR